ncbi:uncharacterized protein LOC131158465 [Malania oleifera]|uniref:uncharacterized protein LOC131158465 n=1 Tax=Malania oleifera TaxID=397392 RepID=UPI0025AE03EC|nr:uncharacterized protein LOC131158465 [Malania oleifera]
MAVLDCTNEQKLHYAAFKMTGEVKRWWLSTKLLEDQKLGDMTVVEYAAKFLELSRFAPFLIPNEIRKVRKFKKGIRRRIYEVVVGFQVQSFLELIDKASVLEKSIQSSTKSLEHKKRPTPPSFQSEVSQGSGKKGKEAVGSVCLKCNKRHRGECWFGTSNCYKCGKPRYFRKDCREPLSMVSV